MKNYFDELENLPYSEICETMEPTYSDKVRCRIPVLMHSIPSGEPKDIQIPAKRPNILNINFNPPPTTLTTCNYITIDVPPYILHSYYNSEGIPKGSKLIVTFLGGDISNIKVIGRY